MKKAVDIRQKVLPNNHPYLKASKEALKVIVNKLNEMGIDIDDLS